MQITPLAIKRCCPPNNPNPQLKDSNWTELILFSIWDFDSSRLRRVGDLRPANAIGEPEKSAGTVDTCDAVETEWAALSAVQQFYLSRTAVFVVIWKVTDGPAGLEAISKCLVDIQVSS